MRTHTEQYSILQGLTGHGHTGIDEGSKVRYLIAGIKTTALDSVKIQIMTDTTLRVNFDSCVSLYKTSSSNLLLFLIQLLEFLQ